MSRISGGLQTAGERDAVHAGQAHVHQDQVGPRRRSWARAPALSPPRRPPSATGRARAAPLRGEASSSTTRTTGRIAGRRRERPGARERRCSAGDPRRPTRRSRRPALELRQVAPCSSSRPCRPASGAVPGVPAGDPDAHRQATAVVALRPVEDVVVEVVLLAELEGRLDLVLAAEQDGAVRMRMDGPRPGGRGPGSSAARSPASLSKARTRTSGSTPRSPRHRARRSTPDVGESSTSSRTICRPSSTLSLAPRMRAPRPRASSWRRPGARGAPPSRPSHAGISSAAIGRAMNQPCARSQPISRSRCQSSCGLDALGDRLMPSRLAMPMLPSSIGRMIWLCARPVHEAAIDLQLGERHVAQLRQRRMAGAEIVDRQARSAACAAAPGSRAAPATATSGGSR